MPLPASIASRTSGPGTERATIAPAITPERKIGRATTVTPPGNSLTYRTPASAESTARRYSGTSSRPMPAEVSGLIRPPRASKTQAE